MHHKVLKSTHPPPPPPAPLPPPPASVHMPLTPELPPGRRSTRPVVIYLLSAKGRASAISTACSFSVFPRLSRVANKMSMGNYGTCSATVAKIIRA